MGSLQKLFFTRGSNFLRCDVPLFILEDVLLFCHCPLQTYNAIFFFPDKKIIFWDKKCFFLGQELINWINELNFLIWSKIVKIQKWQKLQKLKIWWGHQFWTNFNKYWVWRTKFTVLAPSGAPNHQNFGVGNMTSARSQNQKLWCPWMWFFGPQGNFWTHQ